LPWVRHIYIVVPDDCAVPSWMDSQALHFHPTDSPILFTFINSEGPSLLFIKQSSIFLDPVDGDRNKNSEAIEANLHRITGLSEHFIYLCDDFFIGRPLSYLYFFDLQMSKIRIPKLFISRQIDTPWFAGGTTNFLPFNRPLYKCPENLEPSAPDATKRPQRSLSRYMEHQPRSMLKSMLSSLEAEFPEWFAFVSSHKTRYSSCGHTEAEGEEAVWKVLTSLILQGQISVQLVRFEGDQWPELLGNAFDDLFGLPSFACARGDGWLSLKSMRRIRVCMSLSVGVCLRVCSCIVRSAGDEVPFKATLSGWHVHAWLRSAHEKSLSILESCLETVARIQPATLCINDGYPSTGFELFTGRTCGFLESYFEHAGPWERRDGPPKCQRLDLPSERARTPRDFALVVWVVAAGVAYFIVSRAVDHGSFKFARR